MEFSSDVCFESHVYKPPRKRRIYSIISGSLIIILSISGLGHRWFYIDQHSVSNNFLLILMGAVFLYVGIVILIDAFTRKIILSVDSFEFCYNWRKKKLRKDEIIGKQLFVTRRDKMILVFKTKKGNKINIPLELKTDEYFKNWMHSIPDLELKDISPLKIWDSSMSN